MGKVLNSIILGLISPLRKNHSSARKLANKGKQVLSRSHAPTHTQPSQVKLTQPIDSFNRSQTLSTVQSSTPPRFSPQTDTLYGVTLSEVIEKLPTYQAAAQKPIHELTEQERIDREIFDFFKQRYDLPSASIPTSTPKVTLPPVKPKPVEPISLYDPSPATTTTTSSIPAKRSIQLPTSTTPVKKPNLSNVQTVASRPVLALGNEVPFQELFGRDLSQVTLSQNGNNTCYLLSTLDAILHNPRGENLLNRIKIHKNGDTYQVRFPGQRGKASEIITVSEAELNRRGGVDSSAPGIRLIEKAYLKISGIRAGQYDESATALNAIFGEAGMTPVTIQNSRNTSGRILQGDHEVVDWRQSDGTMGTRLIPIQPEHWIGHFGFLHEERACQFKQLIQHARQQPEIDVLTAIRIGNPVTMTDKVRGLSYQSPTGGHYYSIRLFDSTAEEIVLADPFNTARSFKVPFEQFMREYNIEGMRLDPV